MQRRDRNASLKFTAYHNVGTDRQISRTLGSLF